MGAFNGGAFLILAVLVAFLVFRREIAAWVEGPSTPALPCDVCGDLTPVDARRAAPVLCERCSPVAQSVKGGVRS